MPTYLEKSLFPKIAGSHGFKDALCDIRKFSFTRMDLVSLQLGERGNSALSCDSIRFDYSLLGLWRKHIDRIVVSGFEVTAEYKDGAFLIPGLEFKNVLKNSFNKNNGAPHDINEQKLPLSIRECEILHSTVILKLGLNECRIPFRANVQLLTPDENDREYGYDLRLYLYPRGETIELKSYFDTIKKTRVCDITAHGLNLLKFADFTRSLSGLKIEGNADVQSTLDFKAKDFTLRFDLADMNIEYNAFKIQNRNRGNPLRIEITKEEDVFHFSFSPFCIISPVALEISMDKHTDCTLRISNNGIGINGFFFIKIDAESVNNRFPAPLQLSQSFSFPLAFHGAFEKGTAWRFHVDSSLSNTPLRFNTPEGELAVLPKLFSLHADGKGKEGTARYEMEMSDINYVAEFAKARFHDFTIFGDIVIQNGLPLETRVFANVSDAEFGMGKFHAEKISARIPFKWPYSLLEKNASGNEEGGYFTVEELYYEGRKLGSLSSLLRQESLGFTIAGQHNNIFPEFILNFSGTAGVKNNEITSSIDFHTSKEQKQVKIKLGELLPGLKGIFYEGCFEFSGNWSFTNGTVRSSIETRVHNSKIESSKKKFIIEGIDLDLKLQDIFNFRSLPKQILKFDNIVWGDIQIGKGEIQFQIESPNIFSLEKSKFSWCYGNIYTPSFHIEPEKEELDVVFYCDRLRLATVLEQFKAANVKGSGTVNGLIPISIKDGKIKFVDGFLYSTPGEEGIIRFNTDNLATGMQGIQQNIQMEIAREALNNFQYDWAKLFLNSEGNELTLAMQLDGKPAGLLPFGYKKNVGLYKENGNSEKKAHFQGLRFDINFRLPLDEMLHYGKGFNYLFKEQQSGEDRKIKEK
ncbi:MAG: YdbH domain-containing protein [Candidatus Brocadiaceae bacterium]|nr:YdbH domain-containing protein [Candidatus Brocadiaceae bacterium]